MKEPLNQFAERLIRNGEIQEFLDGLIEKGVYPEALRAMIDKAIMETNTNKSCSKRFNDNGIRKFRCD